MREIVIDIETYSSTNLTKSGVFRYAEAPDFEVLLVGIADGDDPPQVYDMKSGVSGAALDWLKHTLLNPDVKKLAWNSQFEIVCLEKHFGITLDTSQWEDIMIHACYLGLPRSLKQCGEALNLSEDVAKKDTGDMLIRYFCQPHTPTRSDPTTRHLPTLPLGEPDSAWETFKEYCAGDVTAERYIHKLLSNVPVPAHVWEEWRLDLKINSRGMRVDTDLVDGAIAINDEMRAKLTAEAAELSGLDNPNSVKQLRTWLNKELDEDESKLQKADVIKYLARDDVPENVTRLMEIRRELGKSSVSKYAALSNAVSADGRLRGSLAFYGTHTGRWAGRIFQPQNLVRGGMKLRDLEEARVFVSCGDYWIMQYMYDSPATVLSELVRTAIVPTPGNMFVVVDFSQVEARYVAFIAGEQWAVDAFRDGRDLYKETASRLFNVEVKDVTKEQRQQAKTACLACNYGGAVGAMKAMDYGHVIPEDKYQGMVDVYRKANGHIVNLWALTGNAAMSAVRHPGVYHPVKPGIGFVCEKGFLRLALPSGRSLYYPRPAIEIDKRFNREGLTYEGINAVTHKWERIKTFGGKLVENFVSAACRDLLAYGIAQVEQEGYPVVLHVHDEVVIEVPETKETEYMVNKLAGIFARLPEWAAGMPHKAEGFASAFYRKG